MPIFKYFKHCNIVNLFTSINGTLKIKGISIYVGTKGVFDPGGKF